MQLVAYGAQDIYLTGNPQITFFKVVYRRHTNFAIESIEQTFNGQADFGKKVTVTVSRNGDLITRVYLQVDLPKIETEGESLCAWTRNLGHIMIKQVEVEIGGQRIDRQFGEWLTIWAPKTGPSVRRRTVICASPDLLAPLNITRTDSPFRWTGFGGQVKIIIRHSAFGIPSARLRPLNAILQVFLSAARGECRAPVGVR